MPSVTVRSLVLEGQGRDRRNGRVGERRKEEEMNIC